MKTDHLSIRYFKRTKLPSQTLFTSGISLLLGYFRQMLFWVNLCTTLLYRCHDVPLSIYLPIYLPIYLSTLLSAYSAHLRIGAEFKKMFVRPVLIFKCILLSAYSTHLRILAEFKKMFARPVLIFQCTRTKNNLL